MAASSNIETNAELALVELEFQVKRLEIKMLLEVNCDNMENIVFGIRSKFKNVLAPLAHEAEEVAEVFATFRTLRQGAYRNLACLRNDIVKLNKFKEVDSHAQYLMRHYERLTLKFEKAKKIGMEFADKTDAHMKASRKCHHLFVAAECVMDLEQISIPDFNWIPSVDVFVIDTIAEEWKRMGLKRKVQQLIQEQEV